MAETNPTALDDGFSEAERHYFSTGGDVSDALATENADALARAPEAVAPAVEPQKPGAPVAPAPQTQGTQPPVGAQPTPPAADDDPGDEPGQPGKPPRRVSYRKFQAEAEARATLERQIQEQAVKNARVEERLALLQQALIEPAQPQQPAKEKPDPEKDIFGYARYLEEQLTEVANKVNGYEQQITAGQAEMDQERAYFDSLNSFAGREPNFLGAYTFLLRNRAAELMAPRYPHATFDQLMRAEIDPDIADALRQEERELYHGAFKDKRSPAEQIFRMAQLRGFRPPAAQPAPAPANGAANGASNGAPQANGATAAAQQARPGTPLAAVPNGTAAPSNGAAPANGAAPVNGSAPSATDLVESIRRGQGAAMSLSNASGGTGIELTPQVLADMPQEQFDALFNELQARGDKQRLMDLFGH